MILYEWWYIYSTFAQTLYCDNRIFHGIISIRLLIWWTYKYYTRTVSMQFRDRTIIIPLSHPPLVHNSYRLCSKIHCMELLDWLLELQLTSWLWPTHMHHYTGVAIYSVSHTQCNGSKSDSRSCLDWRLWKTLRVHERRPMHYSVQGVWLLYTN